MNKAFFTGNTLRPGIALIALLTLGACSSSPTSTGIEPVPQVADLQVVDCLLPGHMRRLGSSRAYMTPRRPTQTTAADCRIRGGEYVAYDRADYRTALNVWLPSAETGDPEAQTHVGEIFERGLGGEPNYEAAAIWYRRAAEQGNQRAQFNLGTLYEQGLGVEQDRLEALNWYRLAWGLPEDHLIYQSAAQEAEADLRARLEQELAEKNGRINLLRNQIAQLQTEAEQQLAEAAPAQQELAQLETWVANLEQDYSVTRQRYDNLPRFREPQSGTPAAAATLNGETITVGDMEFGRYHALIIANQSYQHIEDLLTPYADAHRARRVLEEQYGFDVTLLLDADNISIMQAMNELNNRLGEQDNLLIFYAGHGSTIGAGDTETGYWLPVNATPPPDDTFWVANEFITRHLSRIPAKRVMVVADSCYAGLLSSDPGYLIMGGAQFGEDYVRYKLPNRSRLLLSSGGNHPVLDNDAGDGHSVFAQAFLDVLESADGILSAPQLFMLVRSRVAETTERIGFEQVPEFKAIRGAGHEVGDFFFVRQQRTDS